MKTDIVMNGSMVEKPHLIKNGIRITLQYGEFRSDCGSRLVKFVSFGSSSTSRTPMRQESQSTSSSSTLSSSPAVGELSDSRKGRWEEQ